MAKAMVALATITLSGTQARVTFSSIPSTYRDLRLVMVAATNINSNNFMRLNNDSAGNYAQVYVTGNGSTVTSGGFIGGSFVGTDSSGFTTTVVGDTNHIIDILDYSATDKHKPMLFRSNRAGGAIDMMVGRWASTAAVTSLYVDATNGGASGFTAGSTFSLYGVVG